jgi:type IV pilus assembly protein PilA
MTSLVARRARGTADQGFTLIELLVVIIIIGILAAIAIPVFLNQRKKAWDASAKSDLRNFASFEEIYLNDYGTYGTIAQVVAAEPKLQPSPQVTLSVVFYNTDQSYCLSAQHTGDTQVWYYDSLAGGLQPKASTGCPKTTSGTAGDSMTG